MSKGKFVEVIGGKAMEHGTVGEIVDILGEGIYLVGLTNGNQYIAVEKNLKPVGRE